MTPPRPPRTPRTGSQLVRMVVVEAGAHVAHRHLAPDGDGGFDTVVVSQADGELAVELAGRIIARLAVLERSNSAVRRAVMLVAPRYDEQSMAARHLLARALLTHAYASRVDRAELIFDAGPGGDAALRHELFAMVELLVGTSEGSSVPIRVQFDASGRSPIRPPRKSGVFLRVRPDDGEAHAQRASSTSLIPLELRRRTAASG